MRVYATYNIKGGVGKTTTAVNLAYLAAESGLRTALWDLDPQGAASFMFRIKPKVKGGGEALVSGKRPLDDAIKGTDFDNLDLIPADFTYRNLDLLLDASAGQRAGTGKPEGRLASLLAPLAEEYDAVFLDCPPSASLASENVLNAADVIVVPLIPTTLSVRTLEQISDLLDEAKGKRPEIFAFCSMVDRRKKIHREIAAQLAAEREDVAKTGISALSVIESMSVWRSPVTVIAPSSAAAKSYRALWRELRGREQRSGGQPD
jgi:cellulose biosynthesis protein BcsQ